MAWPCSALGRCSPVRPAGLPRAGWEAGLVFVFLPATEGLQLIIYSSGERRDLVVVWEQSKSLFSGKVTNRC